MDQTTDIQLSTDTLSLSKDSLTPDTLAIQRQAEYDRDTSMFTPPPILQSPVHPNSEKITRSRSNTPIEPQESEPETESELEEEKTEVKTYDIKKEEKLTLLSQSANTEQTQSPPMSQSPQTDLEKLMEGLLQNINMNLNIQYTNLNTQLGHLETNFNNKLDNNTEKLNNKLDSNTEKLETNLEKLDNNTQEQMRQLQTTLVNMETKIRQDIETKLQEYKQSLKETNVKVSSNTNKIIENSTIITENTHKIERLKSQVETQILKIEKTLTESKNIIDKENKDYKNLRATKQKEKTTNITWTTDPEQYKTTENTEGQSIKPSKALSILLKEDKPIFDGVNPEKFLEKLEAYVKSLKLTEQETLENFHIFLKDKALQWWNLIKLEMETWEGVKERILDYWVDKAMLKQKWEKLNCKPYFDIERFVLGALELQNQLKPERTIEKRIEKVTMKLLSPIKEILFMKKPKTIEQYLTDIKEFRKINSTNMTNTNKTYDTKYNHQLSPKRTTDRVIYNTNFRRDNNRQILYEQKESLFYNWDEEGNAYDPDGICVWENKFDHPQKGKIYIGAISPIQDGPNQTDNTDNSN